MTRTKKKAHAVKDDFRRQQTHALEPMQFKRVKKVLGGPDTRRDYPSDKRDDSADRYRREPWELSRYMKGSSDDTRTSDRKTFHETQPESMPQAFSGGDNNVEATMKGPHAAAVPAKKSKKAKKSQINKFEKEAAKPVSNTSEAGKPAQSIVTKSSKSSKKAARHEQQSSNGATEQKMDFSGVMQILNELRAKNAEVTALLGQGDGSLHDKLKHGPGAWKGYFDRMRADLNSADHEIAQVEGYLTGLLGDLSREADEFIKDRQREEAHTKTDHPVKQKETKESGKK